MSDAHPFGALDTTVNPDDRCMIGSCENPATTAAIDTVVGTLWKVCDEHRAAVDHMDGV